MEFYQHAVKASKNYRFFSKWEGIIPLIQQNETTISVVLFLAESITRKFGYFVKLIFDKDDPSKVIDEYDGFNFIKREMRKSREVHV